jgi:hypothetical protein
MCRATPAEKLISTAKKAHLTFFWSFPNRNRNRNPNRFPANRLGLRLRLRLGGKNDLPAFFVRNHTTKERVIRLADEKAGHQKAYFRSRVSFHGAPRVGRLFFSRVPG